MSGYTHEEVHKTTTRAPGMTTTGTGEGLGEKISRKAGEARPPPPPLLRAAAAAAAAGQPAPALALPPPAPPPQAWEGVKEAVPGTAEHRATHPTTGTGLGTTGHTAGTGLGTGHTTAAGMGTTTGVGGVGYTGAGSGTGEGVSQKVSRKAGEAWEGVKEAVPGTAEHRATHSTAGTGGV